MNIQQNSWGLSFGLVQAPKIAKIKKKYYEPVANCHQIRCAEIREMIKEELQNGHPPLPIIDLYEYMVGHGLINQEGDRHMTSRRFAQHTKKVFKELGIVEPPIPDRKRQVPELFEKGHNEAEIAQILKMDKYNVYQYLVRFGMIPRRPRKQMVETTERAISFSGSKKANIKRLYQAGNGIELIAEMLTTVPRYVREVLTNSGLVELRKAGRKKVVAK